MNVQMIWPKEARSASMYLIDFWFKGSWALAQVLTATHGHVMQI